MPRRVQVTADCQLLGLMLYPDLPGVYHRTDRGLPPGAKLVSVQFDAINERLTFVAEHDSFDDVPPGTPLPQFPIDFHAICIPSPIDDAMIAVLNGLTEEQIKREIALAATNVLTTHPEALHTFAQTLTEDDPQPDHVRE